VGDVLGEGGVALPSAAPRRPFPCWVFGESATRPLVPLGRSRRLGGLSPPWCRRSSRCQRPSAPGRGAGGRWSDRSPADAAAGWVLSVGVSGQRPGFPHSEPVVSVLCFLLCGADFSCVEPVFPQHESHAFQLVTRVAFLV